MSTILCHTYFFCSAVNLLTRLNKYDLHETGVDDIEGAVESATDDAPVFIQMPETATQSEKLAFSRCDIFGKKGKQ